MSTAPDTAPQTEWIAGTWTIDPSHSEVGFSARHLMSKVRGRFDTFEGTITTGDDLESTRAEASIDLASVDTREPKRDAHLRSSDFFGVEEHGPMTFRTTTFDGEKATGELHIKGVTRPVELDVEFLGFGPDPWGGTRVGFEASTKLSRKAFGIDFNIPLDGGKLMIGDEITVYLSAEAVLQQDAPA